MTTLDILIAARAEVEKGWGRAWAISPDGNVCALGAIDVALGASREIVKSCSSLAWDHWDAIEALGEAGPGPAELVPFNDHPHTTKADVLALFDRAINAEAAKVSPDPSHTYTLAAA